MGSLCNVTGEKFNKLTVIDIAGRDNHGGVTWNCKCDCGNSTIVTLSHLKTGHTKSCGCFYKEVVGKHDKTIHGETGSVEYSKWNMMMQRCYNKKFHRYKNYGGRGIVVCEEWKDVSKFISDMGRCPDGYSLERIDVNGNYNKDNCKWIPISEQPKNKQNSIRVDGKQLKELAIINNTTYMTEYRKYKKSVDN